MVSVHWFGITSNFLPICRLLLYRLPLYPISLYSLCSPTVYTPSLYLVFSVPFLMLVVLMARDAVGILTLGEQTVMAKTDGSLQIQIPDPTNPGRSINWNRQYYAVPLELRPPSRIHSHLDPISPLIILFPCYHPIPHVLYLVLKPPPRLRAIHVPC